VSNYFSYCDAKILPKIYAEFVYKITIARIGQLSAAFFAQGKLVWLITSDLPCLLILKTSGHKASQAPHPMHKFLSILIDIDYKC